MLVLLNGSALAINWEDQHLPAIEIHRVMPALQQMRNDAFTDPAAPAGYRYFQSTIHGRPS